MSTEDPAETPAIRDPRRRRRMRIVAAALVFLVGLVLGEIAARIWVSRWTDEKLATFVDGGSSIGRFAAHPYLPYALRPDFVGKDTRHDALGFRGDGLPQDRAADSHLVVCIGGSTTYGIYVQPDESYPEQLEQRLQADGLDAHVLNAGVPGWVSTELLLDLQLRVLPLEPSAVVVYTGRNELFPQCYNDFRPDYSHYRNGAYAPGADNRVHKKLFRVSHLFLLLATRRGDRFGWSGIANNPAYGCLQRANRPNAAEILENLKDPERERPYRENVRTMVAACRARGVDIVLVTMAYDGKRLATGNVDFSEEILEPFQARVERNNDILREVAAATDAALVEGAELARRPELLKDDCHVGVEGAGLRAELVAAVLGPLLRKR